MDDKFLACANHDKRVEDWTQEEFHEWAASAKDPLLMSTLARKQCAVESSHDVKSGTRFEDIDTDLAGSEYVDYIWSYYES